MPISRWEMSAWTSSWRNSTGSSIVMMWHWRVSLTVRSRQAVVELLPVPVGPVTTIRPRGSLAQPSTTSGRPSWSALGGLSTERKTKEAEPRWLKAATRKRRAAADVREVGAAAA